MGNLLGTYATADVHSQFSSDSDFIVQATTPGAASNGVTVSVVNDPNVTAGNETVAYNGATLTVHIQAGETTAAQVVKAINNAGLPFQATVDPLDTGTGRGLVDANASAQTQGGSGSGLDLANGLQIVNDNQTYTIDTSKCKTVEDLLNAINGAGAGVQAQINPDKNGLEISSLLSGCDFSVGENGGQTASELGLRTFTTSTSLSSLNHGAGVQAYAGDPAGGIPANDFTITASDGSQYAISVAGLNTVGDVIDQIDSACGGKVEAQLTSTGNGIELVDTAGGGGNLTVTANSMSSAAAQLGLIPSGQQTPLRLIPPRTPRRRSPGAKPMAICNSPPSNPVAAAM